MPASTRLSSGDELRQTWADRDNTRKRTMLSSVIQRIRVARHPIGVAGNLTRRTAQGETENAFTHRLDMHRADVLRQQVQVEWHH